MRNRTTPKETFKPATQAIASRILASPLAQFVGYPDDANRLRGLRRIAEEGCEPGFCSVMSVTFRRAGTDVSLDVCADRVYDRYDSDKEDLDEVGDAYGKYRLSCKVNWPCHGGTAVSVALARIHLYEEVAELGLCIEADFGGEDNQVWHLVETKAAREERKLQAEAARVKHAVMKVIGSNRKNMRVGGSTFVATSENIPIGDHEHTFDDGKKYRLSRCQAEDGTTQVTMLTRLV